MKLIELAKMKQIIMCFIAFFLMLAYQIFADTNRGIVFDNPVYDCGRVPIGTTIRGIFHYTNKSNHKILIKKIKTGCGCTVAKCTKKELNPGDFGEVELKVKTGKSRGGVLTQGAYFITEPPLLPRPKITVKVITVLDIYFSPKKIFIQKLSRDKPVKETVTLLSEK